MSQVLSRPKFQSGLFAIGIILMLIALVCLPAQAVDAARDGVDLCLNVIVPSLFPFFVLSTLCVELGLLRGLGRILEKIMYPLFHINGTCSGAFLLGIVGGYPVGARTAIELYKKGQCTRQEAERMLSFCNNSGPAFILGVVGAGIFSSSKAGLWLYGAHVAASVLVGLVFRFYHGQNSKLQSQGSKEIHTGGFADAFTASVKSAFSSTLNICGFIIFFTVLIRMLFYAGVITTFANVLVIIFRGIGMRRDWAESFLTGLIEMTSGVWSLRNMAGAMGDRLCMAAFILGWAGLSVHCQVLSFIGDSGLSPKTYFGGKMLHGVFSAGFIFAASRLLHWDLPVSEYLATQVSTIAELNFHRALCVSTATAILIWCILTVFSIGILVRDYGIRRDNGV